MPIVAPNAQAFADEVPWYRDWRKPQEPLWAVTAFYGRGLDTVFSDSLFSMFNPAENEERIVAVTLRRQVGAFTDHVTFEVEGMYGYHYGEQQYHEFSAAVYARWMTFPWNDYVLTSLAAGLGPSFTDVTPELEKRQHGQSDVQWLNQFNVEVTGGLPKYPDWQLLVRLQHRSGAFGAINGVTDASNFWTLGVLKRF